MLNIVIFPKLGFPSGSFHSNFPIEIMCVYFFITPFNLHENRSV
jgi:hypothetical protein